MSSLLPPNSTALELAIAEACDFNITPEKIKALWNPDTCPEKLLPWLAWSFGVKEWDDTWPIDGKRSVVREAWDIARTRGTVASIRRIFGGIGFGDITIDEGRSGFKRDGSMRRDGYVLRGDPSARAWYRVRLKKLLNVRQANAAFRLLAETAPIRCHLYGIDFTEAKLLHNGTARRDGSYTRGTING